MWFSIYSEYHSLDILSTRQKERAHANPESPPRNQPEINIREVRTPSRKVFTQEQNELFVQQIVQYSQNLEGGDFHYHVLGMNESSSEYDEDRSLS